MKDDNRIFMTMKKPFQPFIQSVNAQPKKAAHNGAALSHKLRWNQVP